MNSPELLSTSLGQGGSKFVNDTTRAMGKWKLIYVIAEAVVDEYTDTYMTGSLAGATLKQGSLIGGNITVLKLTSGSVILYE